MATFGVLLFRFLKTWNSCTAYFEIFSIVQKLELVHHVTSGKHTSALLVQVVKSQNVRSFHMVILFLSIH